MSEQGDDGDALAFKQEQMRRLAALRMISLGFGITLDTPEAIERMRANWQWLEERAAIYRAKQRQPPFDWQTVIVGLISAVVAGVIVAYFTHWFKW